MRVLITGSAGFIGYHLSERLLQGGHQVVGLDNFVPYYDVTLKRARTALLQMHAHFTLHTLDLMDRQATFECFAHSKPDVVVHLAAQPGVRYALENPASYIDTNIVGSFNVLEALRQHPVQHALLASTSSAYGANTSLPFLETDRAVTPLSVYAATKLAMESIAHTYAHLWSQPITVFRFFTVYGPWGRPDMAPMIFTRAAFEGKPIRVFNHGDMLRDFTYVGDLVSSVERLFAAIPKVGEPVSASDSLSPVAPFRVVNIGNGAPIALEAFIDEIERATGRPLQRILESIQPGDVQRTWAGNELLSALTGERPITPLREGVTALVNWYRDFYATDALATTRDPS
jgi:UDP-glucuronate 4-epimerase